MERFALTTHITYAQSHTHSLAITPPMEILGGLSGYEPGGGVLTPPKGGVENSLSIVR